MRTTLKKLTRKFGYDKNLFSEYDNVFHQQKSAKIIDKAPCYHHLGKTIFTG